MDEVTIGGKGDDFVLERCYDSAMFWTVDAIFEGGVLRPSQPLPLSDKQRVRVTVESSNGTDRASARARLVERLKERSFDFGGKLPTREELHERDGRV